MGDKFAVGVDFGGTKTLAGVVNIDSGKLVAVSKKKTKPQDQADLLKRIITVVDDALAEADIEPKKVAGIGVGAAGMVNRDKGVLLNAVNIGVTDLPITQPLTERYQVPARLGNDVEVATLGELSFGAGRNCENFVCIFVGTGIGSGIVRDGRMYYGATGTAGEIGHIILYPDGRQCGCGAFGCLEAYASRTAIAKSIVCELNRGAESQIADRVDMSKGILRSKALAQALEAGDPVVHNAVVEAAEFMGVGLATIINFYNPKRIIIGGGVVEAVDLYFEIASQEAQRRALLIPSRKIEIVRAELGDYAGTIGAAMLCKN